MKAAEVAHAVLEPHFDAVRDVFVAFTPDGASEPLRRLARCRYVIDEAAHDTERHFAATSETGLQMIFAPEIVELPLESLVAIVAHEFGHAADFCYPACFSWPRSQADAVSWVGAGDARRALAWRCAFGRVKARSRTASDDRAPAVNWASAWHRRSADEIEWAADGIAELVTGKRPRYCGPCLVQCFEGGIERPAGLR